MVGSFLLGACQHSPVREPSSALLPDQLAVAENLYEQKLKKDLLAEEVKVLKGKAAGTTGSRNQKNGLGSDQESRAERAFKKGELQLVSETESYESHLQGSSYSFPQVTEPQSFYFHHNQVWRDQQKVLNLESSASFLNENGQLTRTFIFDRVQAKNYRLKLEHHLLSRQGVEKETQDHFPADLSCDGPFKLKRTFSNKSFKANQTASFKFYDQSYNGDQVYLEIDQDVKSCQLVLKSEKGAPLYSVKMRDTEDPYASLHTLVEACILPRTQSISGIEKFFLTDAYDSMTCPATVPAVVNMPEAIDSLKDKAKILLGQELPQKFLDARDPLAPLDFSKAPHFDTIYVSYLVFRADFFGTFIGRLLEYHAARGTKVKILVAGVITLDKDEKMLRKMVAKNPNIELQELKYKTQPNDFIKGKFSALHRSMHVKLFITLSKTQPQLNVTYIGGRNIHDGFIFKQAFDYPNPDMVNYVKGDESFVHWRDFEFKVTSQDFAEKVSAHFLTLWDRDYKTMHTRDINLNLISSREVSSSYFRQDKPLVRHVMSIPYKDDHLLEKFYVEMLDSAKRNIKISTPYFRPTKPISEALQRAAARGVEVTVITRLDLKGDTVDWLLSEANRPEINKVRNAMQIYEYTEPKVILHSKIVLIDDVFAFLGSVNWNKRSFIHDMENGVMIYGADYNKEMTAIYDQYKDDSKLVDAKLSRNYLKAFILGIFDTAF